MLNLLLHRYNCFIFISTSILAIHSATQSRLVNFSLMITIVVTMLFLSIANIFTLLFKRNKRLSCLYLLGYRSVDSDQRMARYHW